MDYEFDPAKAESNIRKHGVSFDEAYSALLDPDAIARVDDDSQSETRWVLVGMSNQARLLTVVFTLRNDITRIISARKATKSEAKSHA